MEKIVVIIEKTKDGFSAYAKEYPVFTTGSSMNKLFHNIKEAFILFFDDKKFNDLCLSYKRK
jgi:predicted RNase H-like HicB family nuclease